MDLFYAAGKKSESVLGTLISNDVPVCVTALESAQGLASSGCWGQWWLSLRGGIETSHSHPLYLFSRLWFVGTICSKHRPQQTKEQNTHNPCWSAARCPGEKPKPLESEVCRIGGGGTGGRVCPGSGSHPSGMEGPCAVKHHCLPGSVAPCWAISPPPHRAAGGSMSNSWSLCHSNGHTGGPRTCSYNRLEIKGCLRVTSPASLKSGVPSPWAPVMSSH